MLEELELPRAAGALAVTSVYLDSTPLDLHGILADLTIRHGRTGYFDSASPSACTLTLINVTRAFTRPFRLGGLLVVNATDGTTDGPRFTGRVTDSTLSLDSLTATAVGALRTLSGYTVGTAAYPAEAWSARVSRIFTEAGLSSLLTLQAGTFDPTLAARAVAPVALDSYLGDLAATLDAAVTDLPDGKILIQAVTARSFAGLFKLDPAEVQYAPDWEQRLPSANIITVQWSGGSVTQTDSASVTMYGPITREIKTELANAADATALANGELARGSYAHWTTPAAPLLVGRRLTIGQMVEIDLLPASAPYDPWQPIVEGWTDRIVSDLEELDWTMELALSDPALSGLALPWNQVPTDAAHLWSSINQTVQWRDALTLDSL